MDDAIKYADMIEVPVKTCTVTVKKTKKSRTKKKKSDDEVKSELINKINSAPDLDIENELSQVPVKEEVSATDVKAKKGLFSALFSGRKVANNSSIISEELKTDGDGVDYGVENQDTDSLFDQEIYAEEEIKPTVNNIKTVNIRTEKRTNKKSKKRLISELVVGACLVGAVVLTAIFSGAFGKDGYLTGLFSSQDEAPVQKDYTEFSANLPCMATDTITLSEGVLNVQNKGAVYASTDGVVGEIIANEGKYQIEIVHGEDFKTVISGLDYVYFTTGQTVYGTIPVGFSNGDGYQVCYYSDSGMITDFELSEDKIVWMENKID